MPATVQLPADVQATADGVARPPVLRACRPGIATGLPQVPFLSLRRNVDVDMKLAEYAVTAAVHSAPGAHASTSTLACGLDDVPGTRVALDQTPWMGGVFRPPGTRSQPIKVFVPFIAHCIPRMPPHAR